MEGSFILDVLFLMDDGAAYRWDRLDNNLWRLEGANEILITAPRKFSNIYKAPPCQGINFPLATFFSIRYRLTT